MHISRERAKVLSGLVFLVLLAGGFSLRVLRALRGDTTVPISLRRRRSVEIGSPAQPGWPLTLKRRRSNLQSSGTTGLKRHGAASRNLPKLRRKPLATDLVALTNFHARVVQTQTDSNYRAITFLWMRGMPPKILNLPLGGIAVFLRSVPGRILLRENPSSGGCRGKFEAAGQTIYRDLFMNTAIVPESGPSSASIECSISTYFPSLLVQSASEI